MERRRFRVLCITLPNLIRFVVNVVSIRSFCSRFRGVKAGTPTEARAKAASTKRKVCMGKDNRWSSMPAI